MYPDQRRQAWLAHSADVRAWNGVVFSISKGNRARAYLLVARLQSTMPRPAAATFRNFSSELQ